MELKELAKELGVKKILVVYCNNGYYKDNIVIIVDNNIIYNLVGKTYSKIPLTKKGITLDIKPKDIKNMLSRIREEYEKLNPKND